MMIFFINHKDTCANLLPQLGWDLIGCCLSSSCMFWYFRQMEHCLTAFSISAFISTQYTDLCASNLVFLITMWLLCSCFNTVSASAVQMVLLLTCHLWPCCLSWPTHVCWANTFVYLMPCMCDEPILLYIICHVFFVMWPALYDVCL